MKDIRCPNCNEQFTIDESGYSAIVEQIRNAEFNERLAEREQQIQKEKNIELKLAEAKAEADKEKTVAELKNEIIQLKTVVDNNEKDKTIALNEVALSKKDEVFSKEKEIGELKYQIEQVKIENLSKEQSLKETFNEQLKTKDEALEFYKNLKTSLSTKMLGETLEQHCENTFNQLRAAAFQHASFEKDNDAKTGSKGDFIFSESVDGIEFISIMFEMKNEADGTTSKKKNEDFFKELDKDRNEKGCEYAVLVSLLETDSELYNAGIVDISHRYPKMYVVRPQFFIPIITLLRNAAMNSIEHKTELAKYKSENMDITKFKADMEDFKNKFSKNTNTAQEKFDVAIKEIDKTIDHLNKVKDALTSSGNQLRLANDKAQDLTIKSLTKNNPTMAQKFLALEPPKKKR